ncbi:MAG: hemolysin III family protein [Spirochaetes bacterium]|nr:hemolysin III family protein [Spirochaetota bacterium]
MNKLSKDGSVHVTDEVFNTASHLVGAIFSLVGWVLLIVKASVRGLPWQIVTFSIYGFTLFLLFLASTFHHGINGSKKVENTLKILDYSAIFPLIAGTYTPFCLVVLRDFLGWSIFGLIWGLAIIGITLKASIQHLPKWFTNTFYVAMGLVSVFFIIPLTQKLPLTALLLLGAGGFFYIIGSFIYYLEKPNPLPGKFGFHEIWHIFVLLGAASHFFIMYFFLF